jgi:rubredoxin---NAD+ reductase
MAEDYKAYKCIICGWEYHEKEGAPDHGIEAGTRWADIAEDWLCPECGVGKSDFEMIEI